MVLGFDSLLNLCLDVGWLCLLAVYCLGVFAGGFACSFVFDLLFILLIMWSCWVNCDFVDELFVCISWCWFWLMYLLVWCLLVVVCC